MSYELIETEKLNEILNGFKSLEEQFREIANADRKAIYTNKEIMALLHIKDKTLKKYRDDGKLGFHKEGDKFWYTQADIDQFLANNHYEAYAYSN
ncbi:helix-turn-helix domain-containing protein [Bacteroides sp. OttesenSCG-928-D19]|nr:helix-turn-helix domain-containing protein [Bacteroides sp. OttesenSCG-928-D19]